MVIGSEETSEKFGESELAGRDGTRGSSWPEHDPGVHEFAFPPRCDRQRDNCGNQGTKDPF